VIKVFDKLAFLEKKLEINKQQWLNHGEEYEEQMRKGNVQTSIVEQYLPT